MPRAPLPGPSKAQLPKRLLAVLEERDAVALVLERTRRVEGLPAVVLALVCVRRRADGSLGRRERDGRRVRRPVRVLAEDPHAAGAALRTVAACNLAYKETNPKVEAVILEGQRRRLNPV